MHLRFTGIPVQFVLSVILSAADSTCSAQVGDSKAVWGLATGDAFTTNVVIVKQTEVTVGDQTPTVSETTDRFQIQYQVAGSVPAGDLVIAARLQRPARETGEASTETLKVDGRTTKALEELTVILEMAPDGVITSVSSTDSDAIVAMFSGLDPSASRLLQDACPDNVIAGWFARPFWVAHDLEALQEGTAWRRTEDIAIGPFGTLRCDADLKLLTIAESVGSLEISGKGRFIPLVRPSGAVAQGVTLLTDVTAELDAYSGKARMHLAAAAVEGAPQKSNRPQFDSLEITIQIHGTATLPGKNADALKNDPPVKVTFRQTQMQSWILQDFVFGPRGIFVNEPVLPKNR